MNVCPYPNEQTARCRCDNAAGDYFCLEREDYGRVPPPSPPAPPATITALCGATMVPGAFSADFGADRCVDGDRNTLCTTSAASNGQVIVCVPPASTVCSVLVYNAGTSAQMSSLSRGFEVFVGDTPGGRTHTCGSLYPNINRGPHTVDCGCVAGSYVTVRHLSTTSDYLALSEIEVFTAPPSVPPSAGCGRCADYPTPESCYVNTHAGGWASAKNCIMQCFNCEVPLDCRYLGARDFSPIETQYGNCNTFYKVSTDSGTAGNIQMCEGLGDECLRHSPGLQCAPPPPPPSMPPTTPPPSPPPPLPPPPPSPPAPPPAPPPFPPSATLDPDLIEKPLVC